MKCDKDATLTSEDANRPATALAQQSEIVCLLSNKFHTLGQTDIYLKGLKDKCLQPGPGTLRVLLLESTVLLIYIPQFFKKD